MIKNRNINIDLVKVIAVFSVLSVHFFLNTNFYELNINSGSDYLAALFRTLFMVCVPLFIITTVFLMRKKTVSKSYYFSISRVLITYLLYVIMFLSYKFFFLSNGIDVYYIGKSLFDFNESGYSWYVKMYIGLFLIILFLNIMYNGLSNKKNKQILLVTFLILTFFHGIINLKFDIVIDWWIFLYTITYYFIGSYIAEYGIKIKKRTTFLVFFSTLFLSSFINIYVSYGEMFVSGLHNDWASLLNVITTTSLFIFMVNLVYSLKNKYILLRLANT